MIYFYDVLFLVKKIYIICYFPFYFMLFSPFEQFEINVIIVLSKIRFWHIQI